jgi:hypothetical protein
VTLADLQSHVYAELPVLQRTVTGRRIVYRLVASAVRHWPGMVLRQCDAGEANVVGVHFGRQLERIARREYGMGIILTLVLSALISEVVKILLRWWMERQENQTAMYAMTHSMRGSHD